jgi:hypothetical protein
VEHVAEGQENDRGLLSVNLEEVMGHKNFTICKLDDRADHLLAKSDMPFT